MTNLIGSRSPRIEVRNSLDGIILTQEQIREQERLMEAEANGKPRDPDAPTDKDKTVQPATQPLVRQGRIYVPALDLYISENRILQSKDWNQQTEKLHSENKRMPTIPEFVGFVNYLRSPEGQKVVPSYQAILDEIYKVEGNWRSENLDAFFIQKQDGMYVAYHKFDSKGKIIKTEEKLEDYHSSNETPGIDLSSWLANPTKQGLPRQDVSSGRLYYWQPTDGRVAGFFAYSGGTGFGCGWGPTFTYASLGVRYVEPRSGEDRAKSGGTK